MVHVFLFSRNSRTCQDKLPHIMSVVDLKAYGIPQLGCQLPLVNKSWGVAVKQNQSVNLCHL